MGMGNNCTKHSVLYPKEPSHQMKAILAKIEKLPEAPASGRVLAQGKCPFCIYALGYNDGYDIGHEDGEDSS